jgi:hypothetical protein
VSARSRPYERASSTVDAFPPEGYVPVSFLAIRAELAGTPLESAKAGPQDRNTWSLNFFTEREGLKTTAGQSENIVLSTPDFDTRSGVRPVD